MALLPNKAVVAKHQVFVSKHNFFFFPKECGSTEEQTEQCIFTSGLNFKSGE